MSKNVKTDSKWNALTPEQRETLEAWLFEEEISYREALERAEKQFGISASLPSIARLYHKMAKKRLEGELRVLWKTSEELGDTQPELKYAHEAAMMLVANRLIQFATEKPGKLKEMAVLTRLMIANESVLVKRRWVELEEERRTLEVTRQLQAQKRNKAILAECYEQALRRTDKTTSEKSPGLSAPMPKEPPPRQPNSPDVPP